jgi:hypothetical protein
VKLEEEKKENENLKAMLNVVNERCIVLQNRLLVAMHMHQISSLPQNNNNLPVSLTSNLFLIIYLFLFVLIIRTRLFHLYIYNIKNENCTRKSSKQQRDIRSIFHLNPIIFKVKQKNKLTNKTIKKQDVML